MFKNIVAEAGDQVDVTEIGISINGNLLPNSKPLKRDSADRPLQPWPCGHYVIRQGFVWVASTYNRQSYDRRYYGPISVTNHPRFPYPEDVFVRQGRKEKDFHIVVWCSCGWEDEHGLEMVFKHGDQWTLGDEIWPAGREDLNVRPPVLNHVPCLTTAPHCKAMNTESSL